MKNSFSATSDPYQMIIVFVKVGNGHEVRITSENMIVSDPDTPSHELIVKVMKKPNHGSIINKKNEGKMALLIETNKLRW